ncbi:uncharacterized protein LOC110062099 [Orbicella faveolata]|uniref:uncharacterized protein LOC110062099 n=1 Tax=Orbicella faveolata TaxID=48498 RepID=UPI0009E26CE5|nr:uncharacterized protein LOC110062099 [Orbicella faveolata]XP_020624618.1 uncharacterized protein LOC110062099 [Orbicella faveolata]
MNSLHSTSGAFRAIRLQIPASTTRDGREPSEVWIRRKGLQNSSWTSNPLLEDSMPFFIVTVVVAALLRALGLAEEDLVPFSVEEVGAPPHQQARAPTEHRED